jgi:hypothetical protein
MKAEEELYLKLKQAENLTPKKEEVALQQAPKSADSLRSLRSVTHLTSKPDLKEDPKMKTTSNS